MDFLNGLMSILAEVGAGAGAGMMDQMAYGDYPPVKKYDLHYHTGGAPNNPSAFCSSCALYKKSNGYCRRLCKNTEENGICDAYDIRLTAEIIRNEVEKM